MLQNTATTSLQRGKTIPTNVLWPSRLALQNTPAAFLQRVKKPPTNVLWPIWMGQKNTSTASLKMGKTTSRVSSGPIDWGYRTHRLLLYECPGYDIKNLMVRLQ